MRLTYAAYSRCPCGAGLAYNESCQLDSVFKWPYSGYWDCSAILLGTADEGVKHTAKLPFAFYEIKSEDQPSARGATTRPKAALSLVQKDPPSPKRGLVHRLRRCENEEQSPEDR